MLYVTNPQDTAPKRLGRSEFETMIDSPEVAKHCMWARRYAEALEEAKQRGVSSDAVTPLRAHGVCKQASTHSRGVSSDAVTPLRAHGVCKQASTHSRGVALQTAWWERELKGAKGRLPGFIFQGKMADDTYLGKPGTRNSRHIVSNGKVMIDIDHMSHEEILRVTEAIATGCEEDGAPFVRRVGLVAMTPSYQGMRIVLNGREGSSLVGDQRWVASMLDVTIDECCKDYTRLSFAVPRENVLYYAPEVLFAECVPYADEERYSPSTPSIRCPLSPVIDAYGIIAELEQELGGAPTEGMRNKFVYRMACSLRHLYGDDPEAIYRAIPSYGLSDMERRQTVRSAMHGTMGTYVPKCIYRRR